MSKATTAYNIAVVMDWGGDGMMKHDFWDATRKTNMSPKRVPFRKKYRLPNTFFKGCVVSVTCFQVYVLLAWRQVWDLFCAICFSSETTDKHLHFKKTCFWWSFVKFVRQKCRRFRCQQNDKDPKKGGPPASYKEGYNPSYPFKRPFI